MVTEAQLITRFRRKQADDLLRRGRRVQARARLLLSGAAGHPRRVDTGILRVSVQVQLRTGTRSPVVRIGSGRRYARWVHDGTGIYGPRRRPIRPRRAKVLVFETKVGRRKVFAREVRGMTPNRYLRDALPAARG